MPSLRDNVLLSTAAMVLVGLIRPGFHAIVNRGFGPEVNGRAAALVAVLFLASLPATAALPTVAVRQVSRAMGAGQSGIARAHARRALRVALALALLGAGGALLYARSALDPALTELEAVALGLGVLAYTAWRLLRTLLLALGRAADSLRGELVAVVALFGGLGALLGVGGPTAGDLALPVFIGTYAVYTLVVLGLAGRALTRPDPVPDDGGEFWRYNALWFVGTASSLAARELTLVLLDQRAPLALVGEISVALALLMALTFAPRVIELPLVHELSALGGGEDRERQRALTEQALHWLTLFTFGVGATMALLAGPILAVVGDVHTPVVAQIFAVLTIAFVAEMALTPATNLLIAEAPPVVLTAIGAGSLVVAFAVWAMPVGESPLGIAAGLAASYLVKAAGIGAYARVVFGVRLFRAPVAKLAVVGLGVGLGVLVGRGQLSPWLATLAVEGALIALFWRDVQDILQALRRRERPA